MSPPGKWTIIVHVCSNEGELLESWYSAVVKLDLEHS